MAHAARDVLFDLVLDVKAELGVKFSLDVRSPE